jgi:hypothetical protein
MSPIDVTNGYLAQNGYKLRPRRVSGGEPVFTPIVYEYDLLRLADAQVVATYADPYPKALRYALYYVREHLAKGPQT